ncbi:MAG TPA: DUF4190 domain-containing protein [Candidatus Cybelea sp.]|jgi:prepilin-type processing-associated H-X9-DG protein|nr:DUF4190 domain-containing protein [Candidatus Cybelea sp.]
MYKIIGGDGRDYGPITADQVRQWIAQGRLERTSKVKMEGQADWKTLAEFPEFAAGLPAPGTPPPISPGFPAGPGKMSALAVTSLVLGVLGFFTCGLTALFGLVLGIVGLSKIKKSNGQLSGSGLAISGICVSAVFLFMIPVMAGMLLPALAKAKEKAMTINCKNNLRQIALAARMYANDNNDQLPPSATWSDSLVKYVGSTKPFRCPLDPGHRCSYAFNAALEGKKLAEINPRTVLFFESAADWNGAGGRSAVVTRAHSVSRTSGFSSRDGACTVAFVDGSVETLPRGQLDTLRWNP